MLWIVCARLQPGWIRKKQLNGSAPRSIHHQVQSAVHKQLVAWINDDCRAIRCDFINAVAINKQREYALRKRWVGARHPSHRKLGRAHVELQSLMRISRPVFCLTKTKN